MKFAQKIVSDFIIVEKNVLTPLHIILHLEAIEKLPEILPGQFINIFIDNSKQTYLRRPFSIHDIDYDKNTLSIFVKSVGAGSQAIYRKKINDSLNIIYPLGNSFSLPSNRQNVLLIGGGFGIAPLYFLAKELSKRQNNVTLLVGARTKDEVLLTDKFNGYANVYVTTEDGTIGEKGLVINHSILETNTFDHIFSCGPEGMLKAVFAYAKKHKNNCEISLEHMMACGYGVCLCCVVKTKQGNICSCTEGPIFNISDLLW